MKILVVEDEADLLCAVREALECAGYVVDEASDGEVGLHHARTGEYAAIVLDLMLPVIDGWTVLERLRADKTTPVLILTARDAVTDRVRGLETGADDYLVKPFEIDELLARVAALIRRSAGKPSGVIELGEVQVDTVRRRVRRAGVEVQLTAKEYALLELLALRKGELVTRTTIYEQIYASDDDSMSNVVDVFVCNLRNKLGKELIETRRGQGYIIDGA